MAQYVIYFRIDSACSREAKRNGIDPYSGDMVVFVPGKRCNAKVSKVLRSNVIFDGRDLLADRFSWGNPWARRVVRQQTLHLSHRDFLRSPLHP